MAKIMLLVPYAKYFAYFQGDFIESLAKEGHEVIAVAPDTPRRPYSAGITFLQTPLRNTGMNGWYDLYCLWRLILLLRRERPDMLICYSLKPNLYGAIAARVVGIRKVYLFVTGLGYVFTSKTPKTALLYPLINRLYAYAVSVSTRVFFENKDDAALFRRLHIADEHKSVRINGAGVNLQRFKPAINSGGETITFLLIARILKDKGIREYAEAASLLKMKYGDEVVFQLLGPFDGNPSAIPEWNVQEWTHSGAIEYLGETGDVRPYLRDADVFVLPSYREGLPKSTLEAMAMGLPIITTDAPGCRETVIHSENGLLVKPRDAEDLAQAMEYLICNPSVARQMGARSRKLAVERFDVRTVIASVKAGMGLQEETQEWTEAKQR